MEPEEVMAAVALARPELVYYVGDRIHRPPLPSDPILPSIVYFRVSLITQPDIINATAHAQFTTWAEDWGVAHAVAQELYLALDGYKGTASGVVVNGIVHQDTRDMYDPETGRCAVHQTFKMLYEEEI